MQIDWLTVVAQMVNFGGLVWLLHRFLYEPIVNIIAARETALTERFAAAEAMRVEAEEAKARYEAEYAALEETRDALLQEAREEARLRLAAMLEEAHAEVQAARQRLATQLAAEQQALAQTVQEGLISQVGAATERLLRTLAGQSVGDAVVDVFLAQLPGGSETAPLHDAAPPLTVRLSFVPTDDQRGRLRQGLEQATGRPLGEGDVAFVHDPGLVLGVELHYDGSVVSWHARPILEAWQADAWKRLTQGYTHLDGSGSGGWDRDGGAANAQTAAGDDLERAKDWDADGVAGPGGDGAVTGRA